MLTWMMMRSMARLHLCLHLGQACLPLLRLLRSKAIRGPYPRWSPHQRRKQTVQQSPLLRSCLTRSLKRNQERRHKKIWINGRHNSHRRMNLGKSRQSRTTYIVQRELRKRFDGVEKMKREARKPSPLSDYDRSLEQSYQASQNAKRASRERCCTARDAI